jgi:SH3-like domain-containing protein
MARSQWIGLGLAAALAVALTAGLVFAILTITRPGDQRGAVTPVALATASPSPVQSVADIFGTRTPTPQLGPAPTATSPNAQRMQIGNTDGEGANLRSEPSQTGTRIKTEPEGTVVDIVGPDRDAEGRTWRNVRDSQGDTGWVQASFLVAVGSAPQIVTGPSTTSQTPSAATTPGAAAAAATPIPRATSGGSGRGQIGNTSGQGANIRSEPGGSVLKTLAEGAPIEVLGPERVVNGTTWRQVRDSAGVTGWIVAGAVVPPGTLATPAVPAVVNPAATSGASSGSTTSGPTATPRPSGPAPAGPTATLNPNLPVIIQPATPLPKPRGSPAPR